MIYFIALLLLRLSCALVVDLTNSNFDQYVDGSKSAFVEFYAPYCSPLFGHVGCLPLWSRLFVESYNSQVSQQVVRPTNCSVKLFKGCGHCKRLAPAYEEVGKAFDDSVDVLIAKVDADAERTLGSRFSVRGFPTLKFFPKGSTTPEDYTGGRSADDIIKFINEKTGSRGRVKAPSSDVVELNPSNFDSIVMDESKNVLVEFYAPWCGHCKALIPTYEEVATTFKNDENCVVAKIDADSNRDIGSRYDVSGYPTIKYFSADDKEPVPYEGGRATQDFIKYLNEKCGLNRVKGGGLSPEAGLVKEMDVFAEIFMQDSEGREVIYIEAQAAAKEMEVADAEYYIKVMKKVLEKGDEYITTESERLKRMIKGGGINAKKKDEFTKRLNVLKKFELY